MHLRDSYRLTGSNIKSVIRLTVKGRGSMTNFGSRIEADN